MSRSSSCASRARLSLGLALLLAGAAVARADSEAGAGWTRWSATLIGEYTDIPPPADDDDFGGWFDQYEFTPNKSSSFPFQIGLREAAYDWFGADEGSVFQLRLESPTSNLGVSGAQIDQPFFNQRLDALARLDGLDIDLAYRRIRTEQLRSFPNTQGPGLVFRDQTSPDDRFQRDRTGFGAEARARPFEWTEGGAGRLRALSPELSFRGGYDARAGRDFLRIHRGPSNDWLGLRQERDRSVADVGGGVLLAPGGVATLTFDFDHQRLRFGSPVTTDADLGYPAPGNTRTVGFLPDSDRSTGTARVSARFADLAVVEAGFQISQLSQVGELTPEQQLAGLVDNAVRTYSANAAFDVRVNGPLSLNGLFKFDRRDNEIQRDTALFNVANGSQIDPFVKGWQRFEVGAELEARLLRSSRARLGVRFEDVSRDLEFALPGSLRILPQNASIDRKTQVVTLYGRLAGRLRRRLRVDAELGYRWAPATGYATDLDDNVYGELRASYALRLARPVSLSAYVRGGEGRNDDFRVISGQGPDPAGDTLQRSTERSTVVAGLTASSSPVDRLQLTASFFYSQDNRDRSLDLSSLQRYWQDTVPIDFSSEGLARFENEQSSLALGGHYQASDRTDAGVRYSFTRARALYAGSATSAAIDLTAQTRRIDSDTHGLGVELGHWLSDGLRILAGYRYQYFDDRAPIVESVASVVAPFDRSTHQHTLTVGVTLTSDLLSRGR